MPIPSRKRIAGDFARGGNLVFYQMHLALLNLSRLALSGGLVVLLIVAGWLYLSSSDGELIWLWCQSHFWVGIGSVAHPMVWTWHGQHGTTTAARIAFWSSGRIAPAFAALWGVVTVSSVLVSVAMVWIVVYMRKRGAQEAQDTYLRGQKMVSEKELASLAAADRSGSSGYSIGSVPIPKRLMMRNFLLLGSMGTGKSQAILHLMDTARKQRIPSVIYDPTGEFTEFFFNPATDRILNPFDQRCAPWSLFAEIRHRQDFRALGDYLLPHHPNNSGDQVWDDAARLLAADLLEIIHERDGENANMCSLHDALHLPLAELSGLLQRHHKSSAGFINESNPRGSESVRLTLAASPAVALLRLWTSPRRDAWSLRGHVSSAEPGWVFITSSASRATVIKPWSAVWLETALLGAMELRPTQDLRLLFFLDELASLPRLRALEVASTQGRKYGVSLVAGIQNIAQAEETYGKEGARTLIAGLQNKLVLRTEEEESARRLAELLGKEEIDETKEGANVGMAENVSHGQNLDRSIRERHLLMPSELLALPDLTGALKLAGDLPIAMVKVPLKIRDRVAPDFIENPEAVSLKQKDTPPPPAAPAPAENISPVGGIEDEADNNLW